MKKLRHVLPAEGLKMGMGGYALCGPDNVAVNDTENPKENWKVSLDDGLDCLSETNRYLHVLTHAKPEDKDAAIELRALLEWCTDPNILVENFDIKATELNP